MTRAPVVVPVIVTVGDTASITVTAIVVADVTLPLLSRAEASIGIEVPGAMSVGTLKKNVSVQSVHAGAMVREAASCGRPVSARKANRVMPRSSVPRTVTVTLAPLAKGLLCTGAVTNTAGG